MALVSIVTSATVPDLSLNTYWNNYKTQHNKVYKSNHEELQRRLIWESNIRYIEKHNREAALGKHSFTVKMNKYGDMENREFVRQMNGYKASPLANKIKSSSLIKKCPLDFDFELAVPKSVDWRKRGYVTPVKDQGQCGSCWAFSAIAAVEGQHFKLTGELVSLSEQNLVDCSSKFGNEGCNGGWPDNAFEYIRTNRGVDTEASYPYEATQKTCRFNTSTVGATVETYSDVPSGNETILTSSVAFVGPISVAIDASDISFQFYSSGIYSVDGCKTDRDDLDHAVAVVGYGSLSDDGRQDYYIVKNSWATGWGDQGYILMARNKNNMCGIATAASFPNNRC